MDNIFSFAIVDVPPGPGFISTSPDNNNKLMRSKLNEITEYVDLNLINAVLHKACTYNINQCKMSYKKIYCPSSIATLEVSEINLII
jgi:hypothetical protein